MTPQRVLSLLLLTREGAGAMTEGPSPGPDPSLMLAPAGFYINGHGATLSESDVPEAEPVQGFNFVMAGMEGILGTNFGQGRPAPIGGPVWRNLTAWLERCDALGLSVVADVHQLAGWIPGQAESRLCENGACWPLLEARVSALKPFRAIVAWCGRTLGRF